MTRVLVVDDKEENLYYMNALLGGHGFEVQCACHGAEALIKARQAPPDLIISDLLMPAMDGYTLLRHWKADARLKTIPFIVYTATYTDAADERLALDLGADAFILKPCEPDDFLERVNQVKSQVASPPARAPSAEDKVLLEEYSKLLIRKLEEKTLQLEATNRSLQQDIARRNRAEVARDKAEADASERAALLDALFESVPDVVIQLDLEARIQFINRALPHKAQLPALGSPVFTYLPPEQLPMVQSAFDTAMATARSASFESMLSDDSGAITAYWCAISPVRRAGKITGAVIVARDITERKQIHAQLVASERMASVGTLAAGVAHEINNPLASVTANLALARQEIEALAMQCAVPRELIDELRDAADGAERVRTIVRDLRIFSRADEDERGPVDVEQVLDSTLRLAWNELRHRSRLVKRYGKVPLALANDARLGQVLLNLVVNAAQAIPEGDYEHNEVRIETALERDNRVVISISDTGSGIAPEVQRRLFTPFFSTKPAGIGTGIGLSICRRILGDLGGTIDFTSEAGKGTTFRVCLPVASPRPETAPAGRRETSKASRRGKILVIDDEAMITKTLERILCSEHDVQTLHSAEQAIALFVRGERFDVVLCDLMMPQVTGMDLYATLLRLDPEQAARVVFATGGAFTPKARAFLDTVSNQRVEKPFEVAGLRALINKLVSAATSYATPA